MSCFSDSRVLRVGGLAQQRGGDGDARQGRAQLVAAIGEQQPVGGHQLLDALGGAVEAFGQGGDLVAALDLDPCAEIAAELLDAGLQPLQPPSEPAHHGVGADRDRQGDQRQEAVIQKVGLGRSRTWRATSQRPSGSCRVKFGPAGPRRQPVRARLASKRGGGLPAMAIMAPSRPIEREVEAQLAMQVLERPLLCGDRRIRHRAAGRR